MNIFEDKTAMPKDAPKREGMGLFVESESRAPDTVHTIQTPDEQRAVLLSNFPRYDWADVHNLTPAQRGKRY
mgnify:CR=1 FL=1